MSEGIKRAVRWFILCFCVSTVCVCAFPASCMVGLVRDESLYGAAQEGDVVGMNRLFALGADVNARFDGSDPVLVAAIRSGKYNAVELLLKRGANPKVVNEVDGPTFRAALAKEPRLKALLAKYGYNRSPSN